MSIDQPNEGKSATSSAARKPRRLVAAVAAAVALLGIGAGAGAAGWSATHHGAPTFDTTLDATPIAKLSDGGPVEVQGKVAEIFGNKFVVEDASGRALVETGRAGETGDLVTSSETVTVQGRFEHGFLHATALQRADGKVQELRSPPPPPPGPRHGAGPGAGG